MSSLRYPLASSQESMQVARIAAPLLSCSSNILRNCKIPQAGTWIRVRIRSQSQDQHLVDCCFWNQALSVVSKRFRNDLQQQISQILAAQLDVCMCWLPWQGGRCTTVRQACTSHKYGIRFGLRGEPFLKAILISMLSGQPRSLSSRLGDLPARLP